MASKSESEIITAIHKKKYDKNPWSPIEILYQRRALRKDQYPDDHKVAFSAALTLLFRKSLFGTFLKCFNEEQNQDRFLNDNKLSILNWNIKSLTPCELKNFTEKNGGIENFYFLLEEAVKNCNVIDINFLYEKLQAIRLTDADVNIVDEFARKLKNLEVLVLTGNWIQDLLGANLPRKLKFLELFANEILNLKNLVIGAPEDLFYIGLGRNKLTDSSNIHLLATSNTLEKLKCIDLSENDIYDLVATIQPLQCLNHLVSLQLEGNPCSVCESYKDIVLKYLPNLVFLDNTEVLDKDKILRENPHDGLKKAALTFTCHRIIGLPQPPKEKGVLQTIHLEVSLPLLEEITIEQEIPKEESLEDHTKSRNKMTSRKSISTSIDDRRLSKRKSSDKGGGKTSKKSKSPYAAENELPKEIKMNIRNNTFKTERLPWSKVMQFPECAIVVEHPENDLKAIRDTFRSSIDVKVVYLKIQPAGKSKKKNMKKEKNKKSKKSSSKRKDSKKEENLEIIEDAQEPQENVLKKVTLANFHCVLHYVNWSDKTVDFYWADHPKIDSNAIPVEGSLRNINYVEGKKEKKLNFDDRPKEILPDIFTVQVGFGLRRS